MADDDFDGASGGMGDEDLTLPKATVAKLIQEMMPADVVCAKETRDLLVECCVEFIHLVSSEANDICEKEEKKTILGDHILAALKTLGFEEYVTEVRGVYKEHQDQMKVDQEDREKRSKRLLNSGRTPEELLADQERLFAEARRFHNSSAATTPTTPTPGVPLPYSVPTAAPAPEGGDDAAAS
ncbi:TATA binding protein-associated phosphoprotein [Polychytrium aggregatum]|uniref:TATA binding protein-associated phosphoprotein n=1 Tax=Polychytrium aggregatum TaxID=110093 RepID=UPI0022FE4B1D|nr:TATA binding protein-associated phosphoprotein [Polychytrium aggregatum]KAI9207066.1 TATA binding protein-associated phosphoprotein [Polychytrium aggregatum]